MAPLRLASSSSSRARQCFRAAMIERSSSGSRGKGAGSASPEARSSRSASRRTCRSWRKASKSRPRRTATTAAVAMARLRMPASTNTMKTTAVGRARAAASSRTLIGDGRRSAMCGGDCFSGNQSAGGRIRSLQQDLLAAIPSSKASFKSGLPAAARGVLGSARSIEQGIGEAALAGYERAHDRYRGGDADDGAVSGGKARASRLPLSSTAWAISSSCSSRTRSRRQGARHRAHQTRQA